MSTTISEDGTRIAFEVIGDGPPLIMVDGAMCYREFGPTRKLAEELKNDFAVHIYDRRGRGESANGEYTPQREVEDVAALVKEAGGTAHLFGASSGAILALNAANAGIGVTKLAMYEPPMIVDNTHAPTPAGFATEMRQLVAENRRGDAVKKFMRLVDVPAFGIVMMQLMPPWRKLKAVAHTLPSDMDIAVEFQQGEPLPTDRWTTATMPALVADGGKSPAHMRNGAAALAAVLPNATHRTIPGLTHLYKAPVLAPVLRDFLAG